MRLSNQTKILTAIVGSYPKPNYLFDGTGRELLDNFGSKLDTVDNELLDKAALEAINDQNEAGVDIESDGEERRGHYVFHVVDKLSGVDAVNKKLVSIRDDTDQRMASRVVGKIKYDGRILGDEFEFLRNHTNGIAKINLPGPTTVVDCVADAYYHDKKRLAYDYAAAIHSEVEALINAGCQVIQFDDPVLLRYPDKAKEWGLDALETCFKGLENKATFIVHICRGYPNKPLESKGVTYKANSDYYRDILSWLASSRVDIISIEGAQSGLDLSVLEAIGDKTIMLGVLDVGEEKVESVDSLVARGKDALNHISKNQLVLAPDCGMVQISRRSSREKLRNMTEAARILNDTRV